MPAGAATRTGIWSTLRPSSAAPASCEAPPVRMTPAGSIPTPAARISLPQQLERLAHARLDDLADLEPADGPPGVLAEDRDADLLVVARPPRRSRGAVADLELLGDLEARLEPDRDVVGDVVAADRQDARVERRALLEEGEVDRAGADVGDRDAQLLLGLGQDGLGGGERIGDELVDLDAGRGRRTWSGSGPRSRTP